MDDKQGSKIHAFAYYTHASYYDMPSNFTNPNQNCSNKFVKFYFAQLNIFKICRAYFSKNLKS